MKMAELKMVDVADTEGMDMGGRRIELDGGVVARCARSRLLTY